MAVPAILGLGSLGGLLTAIAKMYMLWQASIWLKKLTILGVYITVTFTATNTLLSFLSGIAADLLSGAPAELAMIGIALPSNTGACLSMIISTEITCLTYVLTIRGLESQVNIVN